MKADQYILIAIAMIAATVLAVSSTFPRQASLLPMIVSGIVLVLVLIELVKEIRALRAGQESKRAKIIDTEMRGEGSIRQYLVASTWFVGLGVGIYLVGFFVAIPVFIVAFIKSFGKSWFAAIIMAAGITGVLYGLFSYFLEITLYQGLLFKWLGIW